ncbi:MAG: hypothetical protein WC222_09975 [Parachlamydiales bacterium]|jgi:hypothetical protein
MILFNTTTTIQTIKVIKELIVNSNHQKNSKIDIKRVLKEFRSELEKLSLDQFAPLALRTFIKDSLFPEKLKNLSKLLKTEKDSLSEVTSYLSTQEELLLQLEKTESQESEESANALLQVRASLQGERPNFQELTPFIHKIILEIFIYSPNEAIQRSAEKYSMKYFIWMLYTAAVLAYQENISIPQLEIQKDHIVISSFENLYVDLWQQIKATPPFFQQISSIFVTYRESVTDLLGSCHLEDILKTHYHTVFTSPAFQTHSSDYFNKVTVYIASLEGINKAAACKAVLDHLKLEDKALLPWVCENIDYNAFSFIQAALLQAAHNINDQATYLELIPHALKFRNVNCPIQIKYVSPKERASHPLLNYLKSLPPNDQTEALSTKCYPLAQYCLQRGDILGAFRVYAFFLTYNPSTLDKAYDILKNLVMPYAYNTNQLQNILEFFARTFAEESPDNLTIALSQLNKILQSLLSKNISNLSWSLHFNRLCKDIKSIPKIHFLLLVFKPFISQDTLHTAWSRIFLSYGELQKKGKMQIQSTMQIIIHCTENKKMILKEAYQLEFPPEALRNYIREEIAKLFQPRG